MLVQNYILGCSNPYFGNLISLILFIGKGEIFIKEGKLNEITGKQHSKQYDGKLVLKYFNFILVEGFCILYLLLP